MGQRANSTLLHCFINTQKKDPPQPTSETQGGGGFSPRSPQSTHEVALSHEERGYFFGEGHGADLILADTESQGRHSPNVALMKMVKMKDFVRERENLQ